MKTFLALLLVTGMITGTETVPDAKLTEYVGNRLQLVKVTSEPQHMEAQVAMACAFALPSSPHDNKFFDVYISQPGYPVILGGKGPYPVGTVILKQKYSDKSAKTTELYTGMLKREKGFNTLGGDWEYFVVSGDGKKISERGAIQSCMSCHEMYSSTDYVTRHYPLGNVNTELHWNQKSQ